MSVVLDEEPVEQVDPFALDAEDTQAPVIDTGSETESAAASEAGESEAETQPEGISEEWRAVAREYNLDDAAINRFGTPDELYAHLRVLDQMRQPPQWQQQQAAPPAVQQSEEIAELKIDLGDMDADDPVRKALEGMQSLIARQQQELKRRDDSQKEQQAQQFAQHLSREMDQALDGLQSPMFGKSDQMIGAQLQNRERVFQAYQWAVTDSLRRNQQPDYQSLAKTAANVLFPKLFEQQVTQKTTEAVLQRSKKRTGAGSRGPRAEDKIPFAESPALDDIWRRLQRGE